MWILNQNNNDQPRTIMLAIFSIVIYLYVLRCMLVLAHGGQCKAHHACPPAPLAAAPPGTKSASFEPSVAADKAQALPAMLLLMQQVLATMQLAVAMA